MNRTIIQTGDGSHTLYVQDLGERYHSIHGAIQESVHVFIQSGLRQHEPTADVLNILEIGLGTGLNALLTLIESQKSGFSIKYTAIEAFPLEKELTSQLNYTGLLKADEYQPAFELLHSAEWNKAICISERFELLKLHITLETAMFEPQFQIIYFDAFGPRVQPEMWTDGVFLKLYSSMLQNGCLVTYCAKGEVKRTLKRAGFTVETIQGPPGKREMVRAWKR